MEFLALVAIAILIAAAIVPWIALSKANAANRELERLRIEFAKIARRLDDALAASVSQAKSEPVQQSSTPESTAGKAASVVPPARIMSEARTDIDAEALTRATASIGDAKSTEPVGRPSTFETARAFEPPTPTRPRTPRSPPPPPPRKAQSEPSLFELQMRRWALAAKDWLFGGNLVAKVGLLILFIGVAFLVRLAANYVTVPVELRLAGVAAGAIALLVWSWRIRESRRGIALPAQGAALAILMLTTFGAFKLFHVLPGGAAFVLLFLLIAFTCILAVLQDALWLAVFGIAGGFAAPILTSTGGGNHVALFSYYTLLNAGVLTIALKRSWRALNVLGFAFTFIVGAAWGEQRYLPENYDSAQAFLIVFWLFYIAIAIVYAWRRAPELKSYVDGTLVFGVPMAGMALQYGLVKDIEFGMAISALVIALTYALVASVLWRWRQSTLRLLVESFLALAIVFGTLAIPLALDGRWTSAAWAVEGAAIVWIGLKQRQRLAWQFGVAVQLGSWIAFISSLAGLDPLAALKGNVGLGFLLLGVTGVLLALMFRRDLQTQGNAYEARARRGFTWLANGFICFAVLWLLLGMWIETWLRMEGAQRASMLVATALALVYALQFLGKKSTWQLPDVLGGVVGGVAGILFLALMFEHMAWRNVAVYAEMNFREMIASGPLLGGLMLCAGAWLSAQAFNKRLTQTSSLRTTRSVYVWLLAAIFWWCGFALHGLAHAVEYLTACANSCSDTVTAPWYRVSFWAVYSIGLALSAWGWTALARRRQFPYPRQTSLVLGPALSVLAGLLYWRQTESQVWWSRHGLALPESTASDALVNLAAGPLLGALILCTIAWRALWNIERDTTLVARDKFVGAATWLLGFAIVWYGWVVDALALYAAHTLYSLSHAEPSALWQLTYEQCALLLATLSAMAFLWRAHASKLTALRWLALPAALFQALASVGLLIELYVEARLPLPRAAVALVGCWLGIAWCLRDWTRHQWHMPHWALRVLHFGRVIAPWLAIAPLVSLGTWHWLTGESTEHTQDHVGSGWIVVGMWPDYLAAWLSIASLFLLLRQAKQGAWPLAPLHEWYRHTLIPLATLWSVLLAVYWNLRQDGNMSPLPYLPILNPLDLTTGFSALLAAVVWRANREVMAASWQRLGAQAAMGLSFAWFNLMLLRSASQYLDLPYRFDALYRSQFVQAMLSIVWTLTAFLLMRYAVRTLSKPLWMVGAVLLAVVVAKLFLVDLDNAGSIARIVSFIGVGGLMLLIGYLAPLPRAKSEEPA